MGLKIKSPESRSWRERENANYKKNVNGSGSENRGLPPRCIESEQVFIGSVLNKGTLWDEFKGKVNPKAFYDTKHTEIVGALCKMSDAGRPIDLVTLLEHFKKEGDVYQAGTSSYWTYLTEIAESTIDDNLEYHLNQINDVYTGRLLWENSHRLIKAVEMGDAEGVQRLLEKISELEYSDTGTACITLANHKPKAKTWIIEGLLPDRFPSIIYGGGGLGKSFLALHLAILACLGEQKFMGYSFTKEPLNVLIVDYELDADTQAERAGKIERGLNLVTIPSNLHYYEPKKAISRALPEIRGLIKRHGIRLVIIDSIGASGTDGESVQDVVNLLTGLKNLGVATLVIDHQSKMQAGEKYGNKTPFGSVYKENLARSVFQLSKVESDGNRITLMLKHTKVNFSKYAEDLMFDMTFEEDLVLFTESQVKTQEAKGLERVREAIAHLEKTGVRVNQGAVIEYLEGVLSKDKVISLLKKGDGELWDAQRGERKEILYNSKNPKNGSIYHPTFGFLGNGNYKHVQTDYDDEDRATRDSAHLQK